jgi:aldehyde:ferredoxin oxidoreductase
MGGWTGKVLRIDLSTGVITKEDTSKYKPFLGGTGLGNKVLWDEVPPGTKALDPANKIIFGVGPLTGTGAPLSARVSVTSLWPVSPLDLPATGHMGGHWGPELKYAGYDSLIIQGQAASPVWIYIKDDNVEIRDAGKMWGNGIYRATAEILNIMGPEARVAAIGQCGENLVRLSNVMCDRSHSAGGVGAVMGSKKLKAIGILGTGSLKIEASKTAWKDLVHYQHTILGANSGGVVPRTFQSWQPDGYFSGSSRWSAANGLYWGAATPPVHTGECTADDLNSIGLRTFKGYADFGAGVGDKHTVKIGGCQACPIRCHIATDVPALEQFGVSRYQVNTCNGNSSGSGFSIGIASRTEERITSSQLGVALADDYGWWSDYGLAQADFRFLASPLTDARWTELGGDPANAGKSVYEVRLTPAEYDRIPWSKFTGTSFTEKCEFIIFIMSEIKNNLMADGTPATWEKMQAGEPATLGAYIAVGSGRLEQLWPELAAEHQINASGMNYLKLGHIKHHFTETSSVTQAAALINMMMNRDPQCHTHTNYQGNGLPRALQNEIFNELFGPFTGGDAIDAVLVDGYPSPMNQAKAVFAKMSLIYLFLHNSLTLCNYTLPGWGSPLKSRNYRGERNLEAMFYSAVTGDTVSTQQLEDTGLRILTLFRALTARYMENQNPGTGRDQRNNHDLMPEYAFHVHGTAGTLDHADWEVAKDMFYAEVGWDVATGLPTPETYARLGLSDVAAVMSAEGLMP